LVNAMNGYVQFIHLRGVGDFSTEKIVGPVPQLTIIEGTKNVASFPIRQRHALRRSEEHTSELQSLRHLVCRLLLEKKKITQNTPLRLGILAPRAGIAAAPGLHGIRATDWPLARYNAHVGRAGRQVELVIEDDSSPD